MGYYVTESPATTASMCPGSASVPILIRNTVPMDQLESYTMLYSDNIKTKYNGARMRWFNQPVDLNRGEEYALQF